MWSTTNTSPQPCLSEENLTLWILKLSINSPWSIFCSLSHINFIFMSTTMSVIISIVVFALHVCLHLPDFKILGNYTFVTYVCPCSALWLIRSASSMYAEILSPFVPLTSSFISVPICITNFGIFLKCFSTSRVFAFSSLSVLSIQLSWTILSLPIYFAASNEQ